MNNIDFDKIIDIVKSTKEIVIDENLKSNVNKKGEADFVTDVDLAISNYLAEELAEITPEIGFMSEEEKNKIVPTRWILDPIDGTTNLIYDYNMSTISLALCIEEKIVFGVVYNPFNDDTFVAYKDKGAYYNGKKMPQSPDRELNKCLIEFGAGSTRKHQADIAFALGKEIFLSCLDLRRICSSALSICYVAAGKINGYFEKELKPWDYAAAGLVLKECGGYMSDWNGNDIQYSIASSFVCGTKKAYEFISQTINKHNF